MKRLFSCALILASFSIPAVAAKNSQSITVNDPVKVGNTQLPAGSYTVTWSGAAPNVQLTISAKGTAPVTVPAKIVDVKNGHVAVSTNTVGGTQVLESIELKNLTLVLTSATAAGE